MNSDAYRNIMKEFSNTNYFKAGFPFKEGLKAIMDMISERLIYLEGQSWIKTEAGAIKELHELLHALTTMYDYYKICLENNKELAHKEKKVKE